MPEKPRACDRCCSLKTQCDGSIPCARCTRLRLRCLLERPVRRRGRPKKAEGRARAALRQTQSFGPHHVPPSDETADAGTSPVAADDDDHGRDDDGQDVDGEDEDDTAGDDDYRAVQETDNVSASAIADRPPTTATDADTHSTVGTWLAATTLCQVFSAHDSMDHVFQDVSTAPAHPLVGVASPAMAPHPRNSQQPINTPLDELIALGLDEAAMHQTLRLFLERELSHGPCGVLEDFQLDADTVMQCFHDEADARCPLELGYALLAIGLELHFADLPLELWASRDIIIDTLRIEFLKRIPILTWKSADIGPYHSLALSLASFTWCLNDQLADISSRWNGIAQLLLNALSNAKPEALVAHSRLQQMIHHQAVVLMFLHGESVVSTTFMVEHYPTPPPQGLHTASGNSSDPAETSYFTLFPPLIRALRDACKLQSRGMTSDASRIRHDLENYYLDYPAHLLEFSFLKHTYEAEATIWLHGIFIISYVIPEPSYILSSPELRSDPVFYSAFEHSLLLSEILPTLQSLEPGLNGLSPATMRFIVLSAAVTAAALWIFHTAWDAGTTGTSLLEEPPEALLACATSHSRALEILQRADGRFSSALLEAVDCCLKCLAGDISPACWQMLQAALHSLDSSCGPHVTLPLPTDQDAMTMQRDALRRLCLPTARACRPGCFDLSIQF